MLPLYAPVAGGANVTVTEAVAPGARVRGRDRLFMLKPAPLKVAWVMVTFVPPLLETTTLSL